MSPRPGDAAGCVVCFMIRTFSDLPPSLSRDSALVVAGIAYGVYRTREGAARDLQLCSAHLASFAAASSDGAPGAPR